MVVVHTFGNIGLFHVFIYKLRMIIQHGDVSGEFGSYFVPISRAKWVHGVRISSVFLLSKECESLELTDGMNNLP